MVLAPTLEEPHVLGARLDAIGIQQLASPLLDDGGAAVTQRAIAHLRSAGRSTTRAGGREGELHGQLRRRSPNSWPTFQQAASLCAPPWSGVKHFDASGMAVVLSFEVVAPIASGSK